jgi:hypothetical protein
VRLPTLTTGTLDAALSQLVVNFMQDAEAGVREMARVTGPGGVVASSVWDYAGEMTLLRAFWDAARDVDPERAAAADEGAVMRWCADGELAALWLDAGLQDVRVGPLVVRAAYALRGPVVTVPNRRRPVWRVLQAARRRPSSRAPPGLPPPSRARRRGVRADGTCLGRSRGRPLASPTSRRPAAGRRAATSAPAEVGVVVLSPRSTVSSRLPASTEISSLTGARVRAQGDRHR